ncbi:MULTISPECIES: hypothetical protein [unclassified Streptomyces]|uniref:hypothetical protein n=1 Tax=unclassified Streptomyces TaxID=2593676 RepID=UPI001BE67F66|nr:MULTISPECIES: hypothetical protein [unclassified Streptomyces]MBT2406585.1 hypothetical protein [Streptomyces sp. ISL-21]MBT2458053.1 hypothetical protein [Streptomyces sp. ISL-86]MBT2608923.1 hypothetical protein [Streptomyces sp. ISL-87]
MASTSFPDDLVELQAQWLRTYRHLARQPAAESATALRRRLIALSCRISAHPYWACPGSSAADRVELRRLTRARGWVRAA